MTGLALAVAMNVVGLERRQVAEQRRRDRRLDSGRAADRARRRRRGAASDRRRRCTRAALVPSTQPQGRHLLVHDRVRVRRRRKRIDDGRGDSRMRGGPFRARSSTAGAVITVLYIVGDAGGAAGDAEGAGLRAAGHHAGDSGDDREGRRRLAGAGRRGARHAERARRRRRLVRRDRAAAVRGRHRSLSADGVRRSASDVADAVRRAAGAGGDRAACSSFSARPARRCAAPTTRSSAWASSRISSRSCSCSRR